MEDILKEWTDVENEDTLTVQMFQSVFLDERGQYVLARILERLKFLEHCENEQDMALRNFATELLTIVYWDNEARKPDTGKIMRFIKRIFRRTRRC